MMLSVLGLGGVYWFLTSGDNAVTWQQTVQFFGAD
jgi:hypothetical protein